jgi:hypothetical protein
MPGGTPIPRDLVFVLKTGEFVVDWGDGRVQDIETGEFRPFKERDYGRAISDSDLDRLKIMGRVDSFDLRTVFLLPLPEPPRRTID